ncbi:PAS domain S-box protein [Pseudomonas sp. TTU2014-080ASC]|uniref:PAS domain S-box protein n=1 Tax=Pseudomonas sp. TTU2014-080ASC TaxID=1729724 RepID=UPI0007189287|nr:PAS domain S-box protein [Pseudomonas sp. TTU2014-080ASC]KRW61300.1 hypothetical protein AO726_08200 [Pseudomonas sp. TTU2014-080ASC]
MSVSGKPHTIYWIAGLGSLGLAILFAVLGALALGERENLWRLQLERQHQLHNAALRSNQLELQQQAKLLAETIAADAWMVELIRQANANHATGKADPQALSAIRNQLYSRLAPRWRKLQDIRPFELYLHLSTSAEVLLRVHEPRWFGDFPVAQRHMLQEVLNKSEPKTGLAAAPSGLSVRAMVPLQVNDGEGLLTVGALEISLDMLPGLRALNTDPESGIALLYKQSTLKAYDSGEVLRGLRADSEHWNLEGFDQPQVQYWYNEHLLPDPDDAETYAVQEQDGRQYLLNQLPLTDYRTEASKAESSVVAITWRDITPLHTQHVSGLRWVIAKWLFAWAATELLLLLLLIATRNSTRNLMRKHNDELRIRHKQSEEARNMLAIMSQAQAAYINAHNQREAFDALLQSILTFTQSQFGLIGEILHDDRGAPYMRTFAINISNLGDEVPADYKRRAEEGLDFRNQYSLFGQVIRNGVPLISNNPAKHPHRAGTPEAHPPLEAFAGLPIHANGQLVGMLALANRADGYPTDFAQQLHPLLSTLGQLLDALRRDKQRELAQQRLQRQQEALRVLNEIAALPKLNSHNLLTRALELAAAFYAMPQGVIARLDNNLLHVVAQITDDNSLHDGQIFPLIETYCSLLVQNTDVLGISHMSQSPYSNHPAYAHFALESYIGTNVWVAGQHYGTISFGAGAPRGTPFDDVEEEFLRLLARWIGATLERQLHEEQTREARLFLQAVLDSATGVSIITTDTTGLITLFNSGAERLLGYRGAEVIGQHTPLLFHLPEEISSRSAILSAQTGREISGFQIFSLMPDRGDTETQQWTYVRKNGERRAVNLTVSAMHDSTGKINGYLGIASDINDLQQTTRALQKSESRFRGLVANLPGAVYRCRNDQFWTMSYLSEEVLAISGYPASDFVNNRMRSFVDVIHPDDRELTQEAKSALEHQDSFELTYRIIHADGHSVWVREKGRGEYDLQGELQWISGFIWDISDRKAVEDQLKVSQQRFSTAFNTAPQGMALISLDGSWLEVNDALCNMLGYTREHLLELNFQSITHPDDLGTDLQDMQDLIDGKISSFQSEKRYIDSLEQIIWVLVSASLVRDSNNQPVHFVAQIQDFSERIAAEMAIREREDYLRTLLDNVLDAIITIDQQGYIENFNHAAERIFGYNHLEVSGHRITMLIADAGINLHPRHLNLYLRKGIKQILGKEIELTAKRRNGETFTVELAISQISHQGSRRFIAVIRDIEERKRIERMKSEFVSTVSHELRTPLTAISGSLGLINGGALGEIPSGMEQMLKIAHDNSQRLNLLINDLLDMEKLVAGKMEFNLQHQQLWPLLEEAIDQNQPYAQTYQVRLTLLPPTTQAQVLVDKLRLAQVLANLLSNAAKFSPPQQVVELSTEQRGNRIRVSIRDHGTGIPEKFRNRIFSKFSQADATDTRQKGGTGLGLAICKEIIERMGGEIGFDSTPDQGSTFWFELKTSDPSTDQHKDLWYA